MNKMKWSITVWKVSKYGVFSGPYFPVFSVILLHIIIFMVWSWSKFEETENNVDEGENDEVEYY